MSSAGIITGIGQGIGLDITQFLLKKGYVVYGFSKSSNDQLKYLKSKYSNNFFFWKININNELSVKKKINQIFKQDKKISFLINNAGTRSRYSLKYLKNREIKRVFETNFFSQLKLTRTFLNHIENRKIENKSIVMISSIVGNLGFADLSNYASSKGALEAFAKSIAVEYSKFRVRVNCVAPGFVETNYAKKFQKNKKKLYNWTLSRIPMGRWGKPSEISPIVEFLISKNSSYITGSTFFVDGGWTAA